MQCFSYYAFLSLGYSALQILDRQLKAVTYTCILDHLKLSFTLLISRTKGDGALPCTALQRPQQLQTVNMSEG